MPAHVAAGVGILGRAQKIEADQPVLDAVPVLAVVEEREARLSVAHGDILVSAYLELRLLDLGEVFGAAAYGAELNVALDLVAPNGGTEVGA